MFTHGRAALLIAWLIPVVFSIHVGGWVLFQIDQGASPWWSLLPLALAVGCGYFARWCPRG